jgi:hypothetical protein
MALFNSPVLPRALRNCSPALAFSASASIALHLFVVVQMLSAAPSPPSRRVSASYVSVRLIAAAAHKQIATRSSASVPAVKPFFKVGASASVASSGLQVAPSQPAVEQAQAQLAPPVPPAMLPASTGFDVPGSRRLFALPRAEHGANGAGAAPAFGHPLPQQELAQRDLMRQRQAHERIMEWNQTLSVAIARTEPFSCSLGEQVVCPPELDEALAFNIKDSWQQLRASLAGNVQFTLRYTANHVVMLDAQ